ncbi:MAG: MATE family efflux transporter [Candidatus Latescibacteria bacterium]|nr:MATE family efflux transporter [Candidatus Latescibacterota bacterium]
MFSERTQFCHLNRRIRLNRFNDDNIYTSISVVNIKTLNSFIKNRWYRKNGYREVLVVAIPLILSTGAWSVQHFVDRMFLTWYSPETIAAAMPAGIVNFTIMSLFIGTAGYVNTFVAQYYGAKRYDRIGPSLWQGLYIAVIGGLVLLALIPFADRFFTFIGHEEIVRQYEVTYFNILCLGAAPAIATSAMSGFFSGRSEMWPIMWVNILQTAVNLVLDYLLIFGNFGFPELGIQGAAIATVISACSALAAYIIIISRRRYNLKYHTLKGWRIDTELFRRLLRYGLPNGIQFFLDVAGFTVFLLLLGRRGTDSLAATNIAFNINSLAFMPMIGLGMAVSVLVGQNLGEDNPEMAERSVYSGFHMAFLYMASIAALYVLIPDVFLSLYAAEADPESFAAIRSTTVILLRFVALYSLFDSLTVIFAHAIKGAGDTRYVMFMIVVVSTFILVIPSFIAFEIFHASLYIGWTIVTTYVSILGLAFLFRFLRGKWKNMRVIENIPPALPHTLPETPISELEP